MKKHTRKRGVILLACILAAALCACSSPGGEEQSEKKKSEEQKEEVEEKAQGPVVEEQVLYEKDGVRITAKELKVEEMEDYSWATLNLLLENEGSEDIVCEMNAMLVNHYEMNSGPLHVPQTVPAGKKANVSLDIRESDMTKAGFELKEIGEVEAEFKLGKVSGETAGLSSTGLLSVKTSDYDKIESKPVEGGKEIYNEAGVRIVYLGMSEGGEEGAYDFGADIFIENTSDKSVTCWITGGNIDGTEVNSYNTPHVSAGRMARSSIDFFGDAAANMDIDSMNEITVKVELSGDGITDEEGYPDYETIADYKDVTFSIK